MTWIAVAESASAKQPTSASRTRPLTLNEKFARVAPGELLGGGRYVLIHANKNVLIDATTGQRSTITAPGCPLVSAIGGPWVVFTCGQGNASSYLLYSIRTQQASSLTVNPSLVEPGCGAAAPSCLSVTAVGADWIAFAPDCAMEHCDKTFEFQNLITGATAADPSGRHTMVDLGSASLGRATCASVTVPATDIGSETYLAGWGSIELDGKYAIATSNGGSYLEHCGSVLHQLLTHTSYPGCAHAACAPPSNPHMIVWESRPRHLSGICLPSRQPFTIPLPAAIDPAPGMFVNGDQYTLALTQHRLYVGHNGEIWATPIPTAPPPCSVPDSDSSCTLL